LEKGDCSPHPLLALVDDEQQKQRQRRAEVSKDAYENLNKEHFEFIPSFLVGGGVVFSAVD
jgi:hypothetical protein